jgi:hypothetical protein
MILFLGRATKHTDDEVRERWTATPACDRPSVSPLGCSSVLVGILRANGAVQTRSICVSDSLDGRVADRDLHCWSLQAHCTRDFTAGAQDATQDDNCFCPSPYPVMNDELYRLSSGG